MATNLDEENDYWSARVLEIHRSELKNAKLAAAAWAKLQAALLGVFGAVAFAGGLTTIDKLGDPYALAMKIATTSAAVCAVVSTAFASVAASDLHLSRRSDLNEVSLPGMERRAAERSIKLLSIAKVFGVGATGIVLLGSVTVLWVDPASTSPTPPKLIVITPEATVCAELSLSDGELTIGDLPIDGDIIDVIQVPACPAERE